MGSSGLEVRGSVKSIVGWCLNDILFFGAVIKKVRNIFRLDLPNTIRVYLVFSLDKLQRTSSSKPLLG